MELSKKDFSISCLFKTITRVVIMSMRREMCAMESNKVAMMNFQQSSSPVVSMLYKRLHLPKPSSLPVNQQPEMLLDGFLYLMDPTKPIHTQQWLKPIKH